MLLGRKRAMQEKCMNFDLSARIKGRHKNCMKFLAELRAYT
jgi:hypothetical protein